MNEVLIFNSPQFGDIRTAGTADNPLFCLADVCRALGLSAKGVNQRLGDEVISNYPIVDSLGRKQQALFVNEDGLYDVILDSRKPEARKFRKWITSEVLPSIRKSGGYMIDHADETDDELMARALRIANETLERAKRKAEQMERENKRLQCDNEVKQGQIEALQPDADYTRKTLASTTTWNTNIIAKEMGMSAVTLNKRLEMIGVQYKQHGVWVLSCSYTGKGYTENQTYPYIKSDGSVGTRIQMEWTENGRRFLHTLHNNGKI
jgi:anti-repressor protein